MKGKSMSYYFMHEEGDGYLKVTVGRVAADSSWEFYSNTVEFPSTIDESAIESIAAKFFSGFMNTKAQLFWKGKIEPNSNDFGHPVSHA